MTGTTLDWRNDLERWLKPFLDLLGHKRRRRMCPVYVSGLIGPGDRKSIQPMAERARRKEKARRKFERIRAEFERRAKEEEMPKVPVTRIAKLLGMLGSAHDGEVVAAARAPEAELKRLGLTWAEVLEGKRK